MQRQPSFPRCWASFFCFRLLPLKMLKSQATWAAQLNGGLDLSTSLFRRIEVGNSMNYGITAGYLVGEHYGVEFQWNHTKADTVAQPVGGGSDIEGIQFESESVHGQFRFSLRRPRIEAEAFCIHRVGSE